MKRPLSAMGPILLPLAAALTATTAATAEEQLVLEEIIVTASRRLESLQEVPMSVSAFTGDFLQSSGVNDLAGLEQYTPNLKITPGSSSRDTSFKIRGIGSVGSNSGIDPSVGIFIDGVYQGRAGMSIGDLVDIQRIEVLRGPQGTLYGKNTAAGAISIISKLPTSKFESLAEFIYDSNDRAELRGMINIPFGESGHAMRLSAFGIRGDGIYRNTHTGEDVNDADKQGGRARVMFDMEGERGTDGYGQLILSLDYAREDTKCCAFAGIRYDGLSTLNSPQSHTPSREWQEMLGRNAQGRPVLNYLAFEDSEGLSPPEPDPFSDDYWFDADIYNEVEVGGIGVEWNKDLAGDHTLTFINAWRFYESDSAFDGDFTAYDAVLAATDVDLDQYSSELRIASAGGETFDYQGGLYFYRSGFDSVGSFTQRPALVSNIILFGDTTMAAFFPEGTVNIDTNTYTTTSYAAFGQLTWNHSDRASTTLGLRYTHEKKEREGTQITTPTSIIDIPPVAGPDLEYDNQRSDSNLSPTVNFRYFFNPDVMGYASVSRGFKSGGFDQRRLAAGQSGEFDEEIATSYELGWKTSWGNRRLQFNGTLFYVDYEDFQSQTFDGSSVRVTNAGDLRSYGAELELLFIPLANVTAGSALGYNKSEYKSFDNGQCTIEQTFLRFYVEQGNQTGSPGTLSVCTQDLAGEPLDNAPEWTVSSFLQYDADFGADLLATLRLEHSYIDGFYLDQDLDPNLQNDEVNLVNLRLGLSNQAVDWEVILWARNILDEKYYSWGLDTPTIGGYSGVVAPGSVFGLTLRLQQ